MRGIQLLLQMQSKKTKRTIKNGLDKIKDKHILYIASIYSAASIKMMNGYPVGMLQGKEFASLSSMLLDHEGQYARNLFSIPLPALDEIEKLLEKALDELTNDLILRLDIATAIKNLQKAKEKINESFATL